MNINFNATKAIESIKQSVVDVVKAFKSAIDSFKPIGSSINGGKAADQINKSAPLNVNSFDSKKNVLLKDLEKMGGSKIPAIFNGLKNQALDLQKSDPEKFNNDPGLKDILDQLGQKISDLKAKTVSPQPAVSSPKTYTIATTGSELMKKMDGARNGTEVLYNDVRYEYAYTSYGMGNGKYELTAMDGSGDNLQIVNGSYGLEFHGKHVNSDSLGQQISPKFKEIINLLDKPVEETSAPRVAPTQVNESFSQLLSTMRANPSQYVSLNDENYVFSSDNGSFTIQTQNDWEQQISGTGMRYFSNSDTLLSEGSRVNEIPELFKQIINNLTNQSS